jgi:nitric oxide reductase NorD protein
MEEYVGALWHRLITDVADKRYPSEAVSLEQISKIAGILFRSWGGDSGLAVKSATATRHGAKRSLLQRIAGSSMKTELTWLDGETLNLPAIIDLFPQRDLNRDLYLWLIALAATHSEPTLPWIQRNQRATQDVLERFPGLACRYQRLADAVLDMRPRPERLPHGERKQEEAIRAALLNPGSVERLPPARRAPQPVYLWLHPDPPASEPASGKSNDPQDHNAGDNIIKKEKDRRYQAERVDMPDSKDSFMMSFRAESILSWAEYIKVNRPTEEDDPPDDRPAEDLDRLSVAQDGKTAASRLKFDLDLPSAASDDRPLGEGILLPEWHYKKQLLQPAHCRLQPMLARGAEPLPLPDHLSATARRLRSQFAALTPSKVWLRGQFDGSELDLDACVQFSADRMGGLQAREQGLYKSHQYHDRDLACLLLADLSLSTDSYIGDHERVIDVIRDTLFLFSEALSATGDRFALYGFSSLRRENIRFHILKEFERKYNDEIRGRIAAIKPGFYTRMGAAIRYASKLLIQQAATQKLLLILTDGKPNDLDQYEGRYGVEDTRVAIHEARQMGLRPFCVTIDEKGSNYLPHLFGINGYVVIRKPAELPRELPLLYAQLTR